ncbi:DUF4397 domain-containing protein [Knoellia sp. LjRoot47]|uniref:DUF4397 domain-containing protein n=1 Tax=Knoellia sp. LjRoot47 TaxID=3342330 RepID=UPI003ECE2EDF
MRTTRTLAVLAVSAGLGTVLAVPAHAADAKVSILHAVPGATVDVYANGDAILEDFKPGTLTDPLTLPEGSYDLKVTAAGAGPNGAAVIEANDVTVPGGANVTVVAHLNAGGTPVLTPFVNDTAPTKAGQARITVRHTAAAPAVDVRANGEVAFPNLTNPKEAKADLPAGAIKADVVLAGTDTVAIGPADVDLKEGTNTIVYAWGSAADDNLDLAVQTIDGLHSSPSGVPSGTGGKAGTTTWQPLTVAGGAAFLAGGLVLLATRRRQEVRA